MLIAGTLQISCCYESYLGANGLFFVCDLWLFFFSFACQLLKVRRPFLLSVLCIIKNGTIHSQMIKYFSDD